MAEETKPEPQKLDFGKDGVLLVNQSFSAPGGLLHMTEDGGFYFRPGQPLRDQEVADKLPEPYKAQATEFISKLPPEEPAATREKPAVEEPKPDDEPKPGDGPVGGSPSLGRRR